MSMDGLTYLQDTDGDNQFNPGDTTRVKVVLSNEWGGDAVNIEALPFPRKMIGSPFG